MKKILLTSIMMLFVTVSWAQEKLTFVSVWPPGTGTDVQLRQLAAAWETLHGTVTTIVLNRPGADGLIAARAALEIAGRGQPVIYAPSSGHMTTLPDEEFNKLIALVEMTRQPLAIIARKNLPVNNWKELTSLIESQPGKISIGLASGIMQAFAYEIERRNKLKFNKIYYSTMGNGSLATTALASNSLDLFVVPASIGFMESYLAISKIVTIADSARISGVNDHIFVGNDPKVSTWLVRTGLFVSNSMDPKLKQSLNSKLVEIMRSPEIQSRWETKAITVTANKSVDEYQQYVVNSRQYWQKNKDTILKDYQ